jgi:hypothetical protein
MCTHARKGIEMKRTETKQMKIVKRTGLVTSAVHHHNFTAASVVVHHCCCAMATPSLETGWHRHLAPLSLPCVRSAPSPLSDE